MSSTPNGHPGELLSVYLDDELDLDQRASIDRHLADCEDCREQLDGLRRLVRAVADEGVPPVPVDLAARIGRRLNAAEIVRPRRSRFVVPATIAATLGAIGLLVALQWREGRLGLPATPEPKRDSRVADTLKSAEAPSAAPALPEETVVSPEATAAPREAEKEAPRGNAVEQNVPAIPEPVREEPREKDELGVEGGVEGGVPGGVPGGVVGGVVGGEGRGSSDDKSRERADSSIASEAVPAVQPALVVASAAKAKASPVCGDRWSDSGARGAWEVPDGGSAARELERIAREVGGVGLWRGIADGRPYVLVVPRDRFGEVVSALRARGVSGLVDPPAIAEGGDCAGISVALTVVAAETSPAPQR